MLLTPLYNELMNLLLDPNPALFWLSALLALPALAAAIWFAPWKLAFVSQTRQHALFGTILGLGVFWLMQVSVRDTIALHPLLMTVTTMVFGWSLALVIGAIALLVLEVFQLALRSAIQSWDVAFAQFDLNTLPTDFLLSVLIPVCWAWIVLWLIDRWKFKNPFTYFLGVGFFGAMTSVIWTGLAALLLFWVSGSTLQLAATKEHFILFFLLMFPEGFTNGTIATAMTVLWPEILKTYHDDWYLKG